MNTKAVAMMGASVLFGLAAVVLAAKYAPARTHGAETKIVVAARDLPPGTRLGAEHLNYADLPSGGLMSGQFSDMKALESRIVTVGVARGAPIAEAKLAPLGTKGGLSAVIAEGKRAMTVKVNEVVGVAGFALPGNLVDIVLNTQDIAAAPDQKTAAISKIVLEQILVLATAQEAGRDETKPKVVSAVTLEVTPEQAEKLDLGRSIGTLSLVLRNQMDRKSITTPGMRKLDLLGPAGTSASIATARSGGNLAARGRTLDEGDRGVKSKAAERAENRSSVEVIRGSSRSRLEIEAAE